MNTSQVFELLKENQNDRGIDNWHKLNNNAGLESFGIGLTLLRKLAKKVGRNHELAQALWQSNCYDAKVIGLLIDEPKKITREQAEAQVEGVGMGMLVHVFSSCNATLPKTPFAVDLAKEWINSDDHVRRRCAYGLSYELSKNQRNKALDDDFFLSFLHRISRDFDKVSPTERGAMGGAMLGIGKRNKALNQATVEIATAIGPIDFNEEGSKCDPMDVLKHLKSDYITEKLGL
jgi:hypothetical protein